MLINNIVSKQSSVAARWPCGFHREAGAECELSFEIRAFFGYFFLKKVTTKNSYLHPTQGIKRKQVIQIIHFRL
jgi:hypothetical protein